jgi:hypothetical protein
MHVQCTLYFLGELLALLAHLCNCVLLLGRYQLQQPMTAAQDQATAMIHAEDLAAGVGF